MAQASSEDISTALCLLEEAAKQRKDELRTVMSDKYANLRSLIMQDESNLMESLASAKDQALDAAVKLKAASLEKAREISATVDKSVHENPWPYIAGSAAVGLLLGFALGRNRK
jgi:ElaB/YqjD/DUF883 family membrane-anchored ribosome-binding protein